MIAPTFLRMYDYTRQAKAYWWVTSLSGFTVLCISVASIASLALAAQTQILLGIVFATLTGLFPARIPGAKLVVYPTGGHFFIGHSEDVRSAVRGFLQTAQILALR